MRKNLLDRKVRTIFTDNPDLKSIEKIGSGKNRQVYRVVDDYYGNKLENKVVKVGSVENKMEYNTWNYSEGKYYRKYLVPVEYCSSDYVWIIMPYCESVPKELVDSELYKELEDLGSDISKDDFVYHNSRQKCCDYASIASNIL